MKNRSFEESFLVANLFFHIYLLVNLQSQLPLQVSTNISTHRANKYLPKAGGLDTLFLMSTQGRVWMSMVPPKTLAPPESSTILAFPTKYPLRRKIRPPANHFEDRRWFIRREGGHIFTFVDMSENYTV